MSNDMVKFDEMGQWRVEKSVDTSSMTKPQLVNHINTLNQAGQQGEARRLYDKHISGGGAATKDVGSTVPLKKEEDKTFQQKLKDIKDKYAKDNASKESDPAATNTRMAVKQSKSEFGKADTKVADTVVTNAPQAAAAKPEVKSAITKDHLFKLTPHEIIDNIESGALSAKEVHATGIHRHHFSDRTGNRRWEADIRTS